MNASTLIVLLIIIVIAAFALKSSIGHFKGEGGCCCKNRVERAINRIDGAVGKVNLKKNIAVVSFEREVSDEEIRKAVEEQDYKVLSIE